MVWSLWRHRFHKGLVSIHIAVMCVIKLSGTHVIWRYINVYIMVSVLIAVMCVIKHSGTQVIWRDISVHVQQLTLCNKSHSVWNAKREKEPQKMRFMGAEVTEEPVLVWSVGAVVLGEWNSMYEKPEHTAAVKREGGLNSAPTYAIKSYRGSGGRAPLIINLDTGCTWGVSLTALNPRTITIE